MLGRPHLVAESAPCQALSTASQPESSVPLGWHAKPQLVMTRHRVAAPVLPLYAATLKLCRRLRRASHAPPPRPARCRLRSRHSTRSSAGTSHEGVNREVVRGRRLDGGAAPAAAERTERPSARLPVSTLQLGAG